MVRKFKSLSDEQIQSADGPGEALQDYSGQFGPIDSLEVIFRDHKARLLNFISVSEMVIGAVAWFTDEDVINALKGKFVSIVVQKEDFLKPDLKGNSSSLQRAYSSVDARLTRYGIPGVADFMSYASSPEIDPFRCVGNYNRAKSAAFPRMHNKFLIGGSAEETSEGQKLNPKMVWTGSYNISYNAQKSFENAIIIHNDEVAKTFAHEWSQILALSEKLNWQADWIEPEYRIGS